VFTPDVAFWLMESMRLNRGIGLQVHPWAPPRPPQRRETPCEHLELRRA